MNDIRAYFQATENIASSGQPDADQFSIIADAGYVVVINLAVATSTFAIANEAEIVESLGMAYVHIPVEWESPQVADVQRFFSALKDFEGEKIWVHCALNMRVSCFLYLYKNFVLKLPEIEAAFPMSEIWQPTGAWIELIEKFRESQ